MTSIRQHQPGTQPAGTGAGTGTGTGAVTPSATSKAGSGAAVPTEVPGFQPATAAERASAAAKPKPPELPLLQELSSLPADTRFQTLPPALRARIRTVVRERLEGYRAEWGTEGLAEKLEVMRSPSSPKRVEKAFNDFIQASLGSHLPKGFKASRDVKSPELLDVMRRFALCKRAMGRSYTQLPGAKTDWDGRPFREYVLPDAKVLKQQKRFAAAALADLKKLKRASLDPLEQKLVTQLEIRLTSLKTGSFGEFGLGGNEPVAIPSRAGWGCDLMLMTTADYGKVYDLEKEPERFLEDALAYWLSPDVDLLNAGTLQSLKNFALPLNAGPDATLDMLGTRDAEGKAQPNDITRSLNHLTRWFVEGLEDKAAAQRPGYWISKRRANELFRSFQADAKVAPENWETLDAFAARMDAFAQSLTGKYKALAVELVDGVFEDAPLSPAVRAKVVAAIDGAGSLSTLEKTLTDALTQHTGSPAAAEKFQAALDSVGVVGGGYEPGQPLREEDVKAVARLNLDLRRAMETYQERHFPNGKDLREYMTFEITGDPASDSGATSPDGKVMVGFKTAKRWPLVFSTGAHETNHQIDAISGQAQAIEGASKEGGAVWIEQRITPELLDILYEGDPLKQTLAKFTLLDVDKRLAARTEATVATLTHRFEDALQVTRDIAVKHGITDEQGITLLQDRAFQTTQYLQYWGNYLAYDAMLESLRDMAGLPGDVVLSPWMLQAYGINTSQATQEVADALKEKLAG